MPNIPDYWCSDSTGRCYDRPTPKKPYVCIMETNIEGYNLCLRNSPKVEDIKWFVREQRRRYYALQPGGPGGNPAVFVKNAKLWRDELEYGKPNKRCFKVIDLADIPLNPNAAKNN